jgi:hypothetical protein
MWTAEVKLKHKMTLGTDTVTFKDLLFIPKGTKITITRSMNENEYVMWHNTGRYLIDKNYVDDSTMNVICEN